MGLCSGSGGGAHSDVDGSSSAGRPIYAKGFFVLDFGGSASKVCFVDRKTSDFLMVPLDDGFYERDLEPTARREACLPVAAANNAHHFTLPSMIGLQLSAATKQLRQNVEPSTLRLLAKSALVVGPAALNRCEVTVPDVKRVFAVPLSTANYHFADMVCMEHDYMYIPDTYGVAQVRCRIGEQAIDFSTASLVSLLLIRIERFMELFLKNVLRAKPKRVTPDTRFHVVVTVPAEFTPAQKVAFAEAIDATSRLVLPRKGRMILEEPLAAAAHLLNTPTNLIEPEEVVDGTYVVVDCGGSGTTISAVQRSTPTLKLMYSTRIRDCSGNEIDQIMTEHALVRLERKTGLSTGMQVWDHPRDPQLVRTIRTLRPQLLNDVKTAREALSSSSVLDTTVKIVVPVQPGAAGTSVQGGHAQEKEMVGKFKKKDVDTAVHLMFQRSSLERALQEVNRVIEDAASAQSSVSNERPSSSSSTDSSSSKGSRKSASKKSDASVAPLPPSSQDAAMTESSGSNPAADAAAAEAVPEGEKSDGNEAGAAVEVLNLPSAAEDGNGVKPSSRKASNIVRVYITGGASLTYRAGDALRGVIQSVWPGVEIASFPRLPCLFATVVGAAKWSATELYRWDLDGTYRIPRTLPFSVFVRTGPSSFACLLHAGVEIPAAVEVEQFPDDNDLQLVVSAQSWTVPFQFYVSTPLADLEKHPGEVVHSPLVASTVLSVPCKRLTKKTPRPTVTVVTSVDELGLLSIRLHARSADGSFARQCDTTIDSLVLDGEAYPMSVIDAMTAYAELMRHIERIICDHPSQLPPAFSLSDFEEWCSWPETVVDARELSPEMIHEKMADVFRILPELEPRALQPEMVIENVEDNNAASVAGAAHDLPNQPTSAAEDRDASEDMPLASSRRSLYETQTVEDDNADAQLGSEDTIKLQSDEKPDAQVAGEADVETVVLPEDGN